MKNFRLFNSILTLTLTSACLFTSIFAWYAENKNAKASGIKAYAKEAEVTGGNLNRYKAILNTDSTGKVISYSLGDDIDQTSTTVDPYDQLASHDLIIYKLAVTLKTTHFKLTLANNDESISSTITLDGANGTNYLSNVATFKLLTTSDNKTFTTTTFYDSSETKEIGYIADRETKINKITLIDSDVSQVDQVMYLLFDYNTDNIEKLNSANIGKIYNTIYFKEDLKFDFE